MKLVSNGCHPVTKKCTTTRLFRYAKNMQGTFVSPGFTHLHLVRCFCRAASFVLVDICARIRNIAMERCRTCFSVSIKKWRSKNLMFYHYSRRIVCSGVCVFRAEFCRALTLIEWTLPTPEGICHLYMCQERENLFSHNLKVECHVRVKQNYRFRSLFSRILLRLCVFLKTLNISTLSQLFSECQKPPVNWTRLDTLRWERTQTAHSTEHAGFLFSLWCCT